MLRNAMFPALSRRNLPILDTSSAIAPHTVRGTSDRRDETMKLSAARTKRILRPCAVQVGTRGVDVVTVHARAESYLAPTDAEIA